jgi:hypothetical protein
LGTRATNFPEATPLLCFEGCDGCLQCVLAVRESLFDSLTVGDAIREVGIGDQEAAALLRGQRANLKWIDNALAHGSGPFNELNELLDIDRLDRPPPRAGSYEGASPSLPLGR